MSRRPERRPNKPGPVRPLPPELREAGYEHLRELREELQMVDAIDILTAEISNTGDQYVPSEHERSEQIRQARLESERAERTARQMAEPVLRYFGGLMPGNVVLGSRAYVAEWPQRVAQRPDLYYIGPHPAVQSQVTTE